jgi:nitroreductase
MELYEAIRTRRSVRSYRPDPIPEDVLGRVMEAVRIAPSGSNRQPWKFILVKDEGLKKELVPACHGQEFVAEAPIIVAACGLEFQKSYGEFMGKMSLLVDVTIAVDHLTLAARAEGLGTCWIASFSNEAVKKVLSIPDEIQVVTLTPLGYPAGPAFREPGSRKRLEEIICYDKYS